MFGNVPFEERICGLKLIYICKGVKRVGDKGTKGTKKSKILGEVYKKYNSLLNFKGIFY